MTNEPSDTSKEQTLPLSEEKKRTRILQSDVPMFTLKDSLRVPAAIIDNYAGRPTTPLNVASALKMLPNSSNFRMLTGSSIAYGLTDGASNSKEIIVLPLAKRILQPLSEGEDLIAKREAALKPRVIGDFLRKYDNSPLPRRDIAINVLKEMNVPPERVESIFQMVIDTAQDIAVIKEIKGKPFIDLSGAGAPAETGNTEIEEHTEESTAASAITSAANTQTGSVPKTLGQGIFIAHGKNKKPLEQLKTILDGFKIPYKVAVDEPNLGRPISAKVKQIMESCNCAILIFTADDEFLDKDSKPVWRPSENIVYELGASSYLYDRRIVILKEEGIQFATNFSDLGHISFAKDQLDTKSMDLIKELIGFGILKIST